MYVVSSDFALGTQRRNVRELVRCPRVEIDEVTALFFTVFPEKGRAFDPLHDGLVRATRHRLDHFVLGPHAVETRLLVSLTFHFAK